MKTQVDKLLSAAVQYQRLNKGVHQGTSVPGERLFLFEFFVGGRHMTKYIFVTGGVVSGLGKGITAASLGRLLKARGLKVAAQKLDPYINVDPVP